jgi:hypothetical protein
MVIEHQYSNLPRDQLLPQVTPHQRLLHASTLTIMHT